MKQAKKKSKKKTPLFAKIVGGFLIVYCTILMIPYLVALNASFRDWGAFTDNMFALSTPTLENFKKVLVEFNYPVTMPDGSPGAFFFDGLLTNTLLYSIGCAIASTACPCIVGYCIAKFPYKFSKFMHSLIYVLLALPIVGNVVSEIQVSKMVGAYNSIPGMWFLKFSFLGYYTLILCATYRTIPNDYVEAAYMDGAQNWTIFTRIMLPLSKNTLFVIFILRFVGFWSEYTTPMYFLPSYPTLSLTLLNFSSLSGTTETMQLAACILLALPTVVLYACFTEKFTTNLQMGGIKG